jgi:asparagine synthase (glutamine-hydrolysing)
MCGITGLWNLDQRKINPGLFAAMTNTLRHRGPDDEGYVFFDTPIMGYRYLHGDETTPEAREGTAHVSTCLDADLAFGFRRLSIVDLSSHGHQPMTDDSGRYHIVFNGEIYNYRSLRTELESAGFKFVSHTDTEVILYAFRLWGEDCLHRFNGMWAFSIYDIEAGTLFIARDRFGVKPLYYVYTPGHSFMFASEIKALMKAGHAFNPSREALFDFFYLDKTDHGAQTFFDGVQQLEPGMKLRVNRGGIIQQEKWYQIPKGRSGMDFQQASKHFRSLLEDAISLRQQCDVPFGYTLSGGIDSSSIVCTAANRRNISSDITFSLVFPGKPEDESGYIREVIQKTGFKSLTISATPDDLERDMDHFVWHQEEPFGFLSYYGEYRLRELIKASGITVTLEGQGADEIITGYRSLIPAYFESLVRDGRLMQLHRETGMFSHMGPFSTRIVALDALKKMMNRSALIDRQKHPLIRGEMLAQNESAWHFNRTVGLEERMLEMLTKSSIPEQLNRADKSSMAFSTESRFPFLDYRLVEMAVSLPYDHKIKNGVTKRILRESLREWLPEMIYHRKDKVGFAVPVRNWVNERLHRKILDQMAEAQLPFIDTAAFLRNYAKREDIDWTFWKLGSVALWYQAFKDGHTFRM